MRYKPGDKVKIRTKEDKLVIESGITLREYRKLEGKVVTIKRGWKDEPHYTIEPIEGITNWYWPEKIFRKVSNEKWSD